MKVVLTEQQANQLLLYLGKCPYIEVVSLIEMLKACVVIEEKKPLPPTPEKK